MDAEISSIETRRRKMKIPTNRLCAAANIGRQTYLDAVAGASRPRPATIARLNLALKRFSIGFFGGEAAELGPHAAYRASLVIASFVMRAEPRRVLNSDPAKRATLNPEWMAAARVRRVGYYIASQFLGFRASDLARAAGVTKQAISTALKELYDERDTDPALARVLAQLEEIFE